MYEAPQNIFILALVDLYCRGLIPQEHVVDSMSIVVSFIEKFDSQDADWPACADKQLLHLPPDLGPLYKSCIWRIEDLDGLHCFFDTLKLQVQPEANRAVYPNPLRDNSLVGGFALDMTVYFQKLEFFGRAKVWEKFKSHREQIFKIKDVLSTTGVIPDDSRPTHLEKIEVKDELRELKVAMTSSDLHSAISQIHKVFDENSSAKPVEALGLLFHALRSNNHVESALKTGEQAIITARTKHDIRAIVLAVMEMWSTMQYFPEAQAPTTMGTMNQLIEYLKSVASAVEPSAQFMIAIFEISHLRETGTDVHILGEKLLKLIRSYCTMNPDTQAAFSFHMESYTVWSLYGKSDLAHCHITIAQGILESLKEEQKALALREIIIILLREAFQGYTERSLALLEQLKPSTVECFQHYKVGKSVLRVLSLTKKLQFAAASKVLDILISTPTDLPAPIMVMIKYAQIELLLAQGKNSEAYELTMHAYSINGQKQYLLYAARSLFCFSESSLNVRRVEAQEVARGCENCNSIPIILESHMIQAYAYSHSENQAEIRKGRKLCEKIIPVVISTQLPKLIVDTLIVNTNCMLQLYYLKDVGINDVKEAFNLAQTELNRFVGCEFVSQNRQMSEIRLDIAKEGGDGLISAAMEFKLKPSVIKVASKSIDLKRKPSHNERRPSKRRRSLLMPT